MTEKVNSSRRNLLIATSAVGAIGAGFAAVPFLKSWLPSERAKAAGGPVEADFSKLEPGQMLQVNWRGQPIFIVHRTSEQLAVLPELNPRLKDPESDNSIQPSFAKNEHRSLKPEYWIGVGICTHLGCSPKYVPDIMPQPFDDQWKGGFYCPCHNSSFDVAGRVLHGSPAGTNLVIPPYMYEDDTTVIIGQLAEGEA